MKQVYDSNTQTQYGVGAHLYAYTGRGEDDSGFHDWRNFLPVPAPYSFNPSLTDGADKLLALYGEGEKAKIIYSQDITNDNGTDQDPNSTAQGTAQAPIAPPKRLWTTRSTSFAKVSR